MEGRDECVISGFTAEICQRAQVLKATYDA